MTTRELQLAKTLVTLADTLVDDFDVLEFLHTLAVSTVELLDASAAGIMLSDQRGGLMMMASSTEGARLMELFELQNDEGPCLDCFRSGSPAARPDLAGMRLAWPKFTPRLLELGFSSAQAIPLRLRNDTIGALNIFRMSPGPLTDTDLMIGQALADVATVGLIQERALAASSLLAEQLQRALNTRIVLEQAKGMLSERTGLRMEESFDLMRDYSREHGLRLADVAEQVLAGSVDEVLWRRRV